MAKETTIIFLYDTELLQREEDDPNSAILYFYPTWVSDQQKTALCGQLMGTVRCLKSILSIPKLVSLQTGKFFIIENDRYTLAVGSDRNIPDWLLENRANLIYSLVNFYHKDFVHLASLYQNDAFSAKLYHIFDTYLKLMLFSGNIFSQISMLELSKGGNNVCKEANNFLEMCRDLPNALGGVVLYHNKIVSTQLSAPTTKKIVLADPYRIKSPAEIVQTNFDLPFGHQLLQVYITNKEFCSLLETSIANRCILAKTKLKKNDFSENCTAESVKTPDETHNGHASLLKRDTSLLFTAVPEEDSNINRNVVDNANNEFTVGLRKNGQRRSRPNSLNLKSHNFDLNEPKLNSLPSFCSQSSVASTPMTELKLFVHDQTLEFEHLSKTALGLEEDSGRSEKDVQDTSKPYSKDSKSNTTFSVDLSKTFFQSLQRRNVFRRYASLMELPQVLSSISSNQNQQYSNHTCKPSVLSKKNAKLKRSNTIHTITHEGGLLAASQYYLKEAVKNSLHKERKKSDTIYSEECINFLMEAGVKEKGLSLSQSCSQTLTKEHRKSLTLPLKPLNPSETCVNQRKYSLGVQLTPLLNKLSVLSLEEKARNDKVFNLRTSYGTSCKRTTELTTELTVKSGDDGAVVETDENTLERCALFVCGHQDVVISLLMQVECCKDRETIEKLRELCAEQLPKLGSQLNDCMQTFGKSKTSPQDTEPYSFITMDSDWDAVQRGGPWDNVDLKNLSMLYGDFRLHRDVTDIFLRNPDSVLYGHNSGSSDVFYQENVPAAKGLLTPNDLIGTIKNKARKRLERDHGIELL